MILAHPYPAPEFDQAMLSGGASFATHPAPWPASASSPAGLGSGVALGRPVWNADPAPTMPAPAPMESTLSPLAGVPMRAPATRVLRVPRALLDLMAEAAGVVGISEQDVWIEAARLWLREHSASDEPPPGAPALANPRRQRSWVAIDALLADLRQHDAPRSAAALPLGAGAAQASERENGSAA